MLAVLRIRGSVGTKTEVEKTLVQLGLKEKHACIVLQDTPTNRGFLNRVKDYVTWGEVKDATVKTLAEAKKLKPADGKTPYKGLVFHLAPPKKGYRGSIKEPYPRGELGQRKDIDALLQRMI